jgi:phage terminase large subunit-like protein
VLEGTVEDDTWFAAIYTIDEGDKWHDPKVWRKANPNLGISVKLDDMEAACKKASAMPSALGNFLTKRLNVWTSAGTAWMDMEAWQKCTDHALREEDFAGEECYVGLDLAQKSDFAAKVKVFRRGSTWYGFVKLYTNEFAVQQSTTSQMQGWAESGHIVVSPGNVTDFDVIADDLRADCKLHVVKEIAFDPALSMYFAGKLIEEGLPLVEISQRALFFTQPLLQVENLVLENELRFEANPAFNWMMSNLVVKVSKFNELRQPTKDRPENKIDGPLALLLAIGRALIMNPEDIIDSDYELATI